MNHHTLEFPTTIDGYETYIDDHGPGHGLFVGFDGDTVKLSQWSEFCEENAETGHWEAIISTAWIDIAELFREDAKHYEWYIPPASHIHGRARRADAIISAALAYCSYWGYDEDEIIDLDESGDTPCKYFGTFHWRDLTGPKTVTMCEHCAEK